MIPRMTTPSAVSAVTRSSTPSTVIVARVLDLEVAADEHLGVGVERRPLLVGELELGELGIGGELGARRGRDRASAASIVRSAGGRHIRCWSARCTSVPLLAGADGGSGSRSM